MWRYAYPALIWLLPGVAFLSLLGCAAQQENLAVQQARAAYEQAQSRPEVAANAPLILREAEQTLRAAEQAGDQETATHLAYIAERKAQTAVVVAEREVEQKSADQLGQEKQRLLLEARQQEAESARQRAQSRTEELELARQAAEARAEELERARQAAEARAGEAEEARMRAEQARKEVEELQQQIAELEARPTERGIVLTLGDVLFAFNESELLPGALRSVDKLAGFLREHPDRQIRIEGHTDSVGSEEYNQGLSERRAEAVAQALQARGVAADRMMTEGYGERFPIASNDNPGGRQQNRRVEVVILNPGEEPEQQGRQMGNQ